MSGPHPDVAAVRLAVRRSLSALTDAGPVLVACSGGPDSLALAAALAFEGPRASPPRGVGAVVLDQEWDTSEAAVQRLRGLGSSLSALGLDPVIVQSAPDRGGSETSAREARYEAFAEILERTQAAAILLGHTASDQAEQVLLGLARGSGTRSLAGIPPVRGRYVRPLLKLPRSVTESACAALGLTPYDDPSNADPRHLRARVRHRALPALEEALGPGIADALVRTAELARSDNDALEELAARYLSTAATSEDWCDVANMQELHPAVLRRVLVILLTLHGAQPSAQHLIAVTDLVHDWHGQGPLCLPGGVQVGRHNGRIVMSQSEGDHQR